MTTKNNYSPDPRKQAIYTNLQNFKLSDVTAKNIQQLTDPTFIQSSNQDALITYNLVNKAAMRDGLPIPNTCKIELSSTSDSGVKIDLFQPAKGEVWMLQSMTTTATSQSGNITHELSWEDVNNSRNFIWYYMSSGNSVQILSDDTNWLGDKFFDENIKLQYEATGTFTSMTISFMLFRVR